MVSADTFTNDYSVNRICGNQLQDGRVRKFYFHFYVFQEYTFVSLKRDLIHGDNPKSFKKETFLVIRNVVGLANIFSCSVLVAWYWFLISNYFITSAKFYLSRPLCLLLVNSIPVMRGSQ